MREYFTYITGGKQFWVGQNIAQAHKGLQISDDLFDQFITCCISAIKTIPFKDTKIAMIVLKELIAILK